MTISKSELQVGTFVKLKNDSNVYQITKRWYPISEISSTGTKYLSLRLRLSLDNDVEFSEIIFSKVEKIISLKEKTNHDLKNNQDFKNKKFKTVCGYPVKISRIDSKYYFGYYKPIISYDWVPVSWNIKTKQMLHGEWSNSLNLVEDVDDSVLKKFTIISDAPQWLDDIEVNYFGKIIKVPYDTKCITTNETGDISAFSSTNVQTYGPVWIYNAGRRTYISRVKFEGDWRYSKYEIKK
jgi:hypothetical protein